MGKLKDKIINKKLWIVLIIILLLVAILKFSVDKIVELHPNSDEKESIASLKDAYAPLSTVTIKGTKDNVDYFLNLIGGKKIDIESEDMDKCFNITPEFVTDNSEYQVFKFADTAESFLLYQDNIYQIGHNKRGKGITNFALADANQDGVPELFYSYEWSISNVLRSNVAYFDPINKKEIGLNKNYREEIIAIVGTNNNDELRVYKGNMSSYEDFTNFTITPKTELDLIVYHDGVAKLVTRVEIEAFKNK